MLRARMSAVADADDGNAGIFCRIGEPGALVPVPALIDDDVYALFAEKIFEKFAVRGRAEFRFREKELSLRVRVRRSILGERQVKHAVPAPREFVREHGRDALHAAALGVDFCAV